MVLLKLGLGVGLNCIVYGDIRGRRPIPLF